MADFLCELGCEEIPARFVPPLIKQLQSAFDTQLSSARLSYDGVEVFATYRRLIVTIKGLDEAQADIDQLVKGPPISIAKDDNQQLTAAGLGFLKKNNCSPDQAIEQDIDGKSYLFAKQFLKGKSSQDVLKELVPSVFQSLPLPIAMKWGSCEHTFIRPVHWICALLNKDVLPFTLFGIDSDAYTYGHRTLSEPGNFNGKRIHIKSAPSFFEQLQSEGGVVWNQQLRKDSIRDQLKTLGQENPDEELLHEVCFLLEDPKVLKGVFDQSFLELPEDVLVECMKKHQRYFPIHTKTTLSNEFLLVADNVTDSNTDSIVAGNKKVLLARLKDAAFFWEEDRKRSLIDFSDKLKGVVFQKNLGSIHDKCQRIAKIAAYLNKTLNLKLDSVDLDELSFLIKCDLVTQMVFEFPSLQGVMGYYYAKHSALSDDVALAIRDHYKPLASGGETPSSDLAALMAISDRLDTLVSSFYNGQKPTGSQDPLGLRRAANGLLAILQEKAYSLSLLDSIDFAYSLVPEVVHKDRLLEFIELRYKTLLEEQGLRYDEAEALLTVAQDDINAALSRSKHLQTFRQESPEKFKVLVETAVRVQRLSEKAESRDIDKALLQESIEKEAFEQLQTVQSSVPSLESLSDFSSLMVSYFEDVLVIADDEAVKSNRLAFISSVNDLYTSFCHFNKIVLD